MSGPVPTGVVAGRSDLGARIAEEVARLERDGRWSAPRRAALDAAFEAAADAALRVPRFAERSRRLRTVGRRLCPGPLRPAAKAVARLADRLTRRVLARTGRS